MVEKATLRSAALRLGNAIRAAKLAAGRLKIVVFLLSGLMTAAPMLAQDNPPARVARLSYTRGSVSLQPSGESQWSQASVNYTVTTSDRLYTDQGSRAELEVGPYAVRLSEATDLTMANLNDQAMQLGLAQGTIRVSVFQLPSGNTVEIDTPNGALTVLGPGTYRVDTVPNSGTRVYVNSGSLQVSGGGANQTVGAGQAVQLAGTEPVQVSFVAHAGPDDFDQWSMSRDRRLESAASRRYMSPYAPGYEDLDAYGSWQDVSAYGPVWYPSGVPAGWVPYRFGHWAWVEPWGWTWVEDEPWGFCPFHYGRWAFIGSAWGWVPGPVAVVPVYAPALVGFVGGSGFSFGFSFGGLGVAAWFPLGPGEPFFPWYHYGDNYLRQVNVTNVRNVTNINNITNITNINSVHYVNRNVGTTAVAATVLRSGQPVARQVVRVDPQQMAKAPVIPHPSISPTAAVARGGKPVPVPRVQTPRFVLAPQTAQKQPAASGRGRPSPPPLEAKNTSQKQPPTSGAARPSALPPEKNNASPQRNAAGGPPQKEAPPLITKNRQPQQSAPSGARPTKPPQPATQQTSTMAKRSPSGPASTPPHLITKSAPPPRNVPFENRQPAMTAHPGRPLEPQQAENLRAGRPAGPAHDKEFPPHAEAPATQHAKSSPPPTPPAAGRGENPKPPVRRD